MPLTLAKKQEIVSQVAGVAALAISAVAVENKGLTVTEMTELRATARKNGVYLRVVPNTLAIRAIKDTGFECMQSVMKGPLFLAFSQEEPSAAARILKEYMKDNEKVAIRALSIDGRLLEAKEIDMVAKLPTRLEAIATLMAVMKAPISQFVRTLAEPHAKLVRTIAAIRDKKQADEK